jgi:hypothetical protein
LDKIDELDFLQKYSFDLCAYFAPPRLCGEKRATKLAGIELPLLTIQPASNSFQTTPPSLRPRH